MKISRLWMTALLAAVLAAGSGCALFVVGAAAAGGAAGYAYVNGEVDATLAADLGQSWQASLDTMRDLEYPVSSQAKDALEGNITARNAKNTEIKIKLKYISKTQTEIHIRVGTFGDEQLSHTILNKMREHLGASTGS